MILYTDAKSLSIVQMYQDEIICVLPWRTRQNSWRNHTIECTIQGKADISTQITRILHYTKHWLTPTMLLLFLLAAVPPLVLWAEAPSAGTAGCVRSCGGQGVHSYNLRWSCITNWAKVLFIRPQPRYGSVELRCFKARLLLTSVHIAKCHRTLCTLPLSVLELLKILMANETQSLHCPLSIIFWFLEIRIISVFSKDRNKLCSINAASGGWLGRVNVQITQVCLWGLSKEIIIFLISNIKVILSVVSNCDGHVACSWTIQM